MASTDLFFTTRGDLESVADAIRQKGGTVADLIYPDGFVTAIGNISGGGGTINNEDKTVEPTESEQSITYDTGYTGLGTVTVEAISSTYVGSGVASKGSSDLTVSGATVTAPAGFYATAASASVANGSATAPATISGTSATVSNSGTTITLAKTVSVTPSVTAGYVASGTAGNSAVSLSATDANFDAANIKNGVTLFGKLGTYTGGGGVTGVAQGTLTVASNVNTSTNTKITDTSTIGFTPSVFLFYRSDRSATSNHVNVATFVTLGSYYMRSRTRYSSSTLSTSGDANNWTTQSLGHLYFNSNNVYFRSSSSCILAAGTWNWVAIQ